MRRVGDNSKVPPVSHVPHVRHTPRVDDDAAGRSAPRAPKGGAPEKPPERPRRVGVVDEYA